jgi:hypothetical protein
MFSYEKVENVVNPPQNPAVRNNRHSAPDIFPRSLSPKISPMRKHPIIFTANVPNGNADARLF